MSSVTTNMIDAARVELLLGELRLPSVKLIWAKLAEQSDKEGWPAARFLAALAEHEVADRTRRRIERHLAEARFARRQDPRRFRLPIRTHDLEGASHGSRLRRCLVGERR